MKNDPSWDNRKEKGRGREIIKRTTKRAEASRSRSPALRAVSSCADRLADILAKHSGEPETFSRLTTTWMIKYANTREEATAERGARKSENNERRTRSEITDMTTARGGRAGGEPGGNSEWCKSNLHDIGVTAFHSLALIRLHYAKMSQLAQPAGN